MDHIVPAGATLSGAVFEVIQWAEGQGRLRELMKAAVAEVPGNAALESVVLKLEESPLDEGHRLSLLSPPIPTPPESPSPPLVLPRGRIVQWGLALIAGVAGLTAVWILFPVTINGYILYRNSDKTVKGAVVSVPATGLTSTTDDFGFFTLQGPRGTRQLYVHVDGNQYEVAVGERVGQRYSIVQPFAEPTRQLRA